MMKLSDLIRRLRKAPPPAARPEASAATTASSAFYAVALVPEEHACAAALAASDQRYLAQEAPRIPLPECTKPLQCQCRIARFNDRRKTDRRDALSFSRWYSGIERRRGPGRRTSDR
jgi:hypothetical protein